MAGLLPAVFHPIDGDIRRNSCSPVLDIGNQDAPIDQKRADLQVDHPVDLFHGSVFRVRLRLLRILFGERHGISAQVLVFDHLLHNPLDHGSAYCCLDGENMCR